MQCVRNPDELRLGRQRIVGRSDAIDGRVDRGAAERIVRFEVAATSVRSEGVVGITGLHRSNGVIVAGNVQRVDAALGKLLARLIDPIAMESPRYVRTAAEECRHRWTLQGFSSSYSRKSPYSMRYCIQIRKRAPLRGRALPFKGIKRTWEQIEHRCCPSDGILIAPYLNPVRAVELNRDRFDLRSVDFEGRNATVRHRKCTRVTMTLAVQHRLVR